VKNETVDVLTYGESIGFGIRVLKDGAWGFSASDKLNKEGVKECTELAVKVAKASAKLKKEDVRLAKVGKIKDEYKVKVKINPFSIPIEDKISLLSLATEKMRKIKNVKIAEGGIEVWDKGQFFSSTEGSDIYQEFVGCRAYIKATAVKNGETAVRTYPGFLGDGDAKNKGYEFILELNLPQHAERVAEEASALLSAEKMEEEVTTVVLDGPMVAIQLHETVGHPTELDRVLGMEANFAGTSHLTLDKKGKFKFASEIVNITADATIEGGLGSFKYDDEGVPSQKIYLVKEGIFTGYLTSRETAFLIGEESNGTMRATGWNYLPLIRMTNINLLPGNWSLKELIAQTEEGIFICSPTMPSIDDKRLNYHIGAEIGWRIKRGKLTNMIKRPYYSGISYKIWQSCDAICNESEWEVWGVMHCGKGEPLQVMKVGHGAAPARFRNIKVGGGR
jgi:TldD protein